MTKLRNRYVDINITRDTMPMRLAGTMPMTLLFVGADLEHAYYTTAKDAKEAVELAILEDSTESKEKVMRAIDVMFMQAQHHETLGVVGIETEGGLQGLLDSQEPFGTSYRIADLGTTTEGKDAIAEWVANKTLFYYPTFLDISELSDFVETHSSNDHVIPMIHDEDELLGVGLAALASGNFFGRWWQKFKSVNGVAVTKFKADEIDTIELIGGNTYIRVSGRNVISDGKVTSGEFADVIETEHYLIDHLRQKMWGILTGNDKVPYTQKGIDLFHGGMRSVLDLATDEGILATDEQGGATYQTSAPRRDEINVEYVKARVLPDLKFVAIPTGAIGSVKIEGHLTFDMGVAVDG